MSKYNLQPKHDLNQLVFVNTKDGMKEAKICEIEIEITEEYTRYFYRMTPGYDRYAEHQIMSTIKEVEKKVKQDIKELQLKLM